MNSLIFVMALAVAPTLPDYVQRGNGVAEMRLQQSPCVYAEVVATLPPKARGFFQQGIFTDKEGLKYPVCWTKIKDKIYVITGDAIGEPIVMDMADFKQDK